MCCITLYFSLFLIFPLFFYFKILICIDCCIPLFHQASFTEFPLLWFGLRPTFVPIRITHASINLLVLIILSDLTFHDIYIHFFRPFSSISLLMMTRPVILTQRGPTGWEAFTWSSSSNYIWTHFTHFESSDDKVPQSPVFLSRKHLETTSRWHHLIIIITIVIIIIIIIIIIAIIIVIIIFIINNSYYKNILFFYCIFLLCRNAINKWNK